MAEACSELNSIWARHSAGGDQETAEAVLDVLARAGIQKRQDDGKLFQVTLSRPVTTPYDVVVGLRYVKRDGTHTEDHFLAGTQGGVIHYNKQSLSRSLPEYAGTHKEQLTSRQVTSHTDFTGVNTISLKYST